MPDLLELPEDAFEKAAKRYGKTLESLEQDVDIVEAWLGTQPHLPEIMERRLIRNFVIRNKFSIERAKQKIDCYYTLKTKIPELYEHNHPNSPALKNVMEWDYRFIPLPQQTDDMNRVFFIQVPSIDRSKHLNMYACFSLGQIVQEIRAKEDCLLGDMFIFDLKHLTLDLALRITPTFALKVAACCEGVWSLPLKAVHLLNSPPYVNHVLAILKTILKPKLLQRFHFHTDEAALLNLFPKRIIPKEYGGEEKSLDELQELWKLKFDEYIPRFDKLQSMTVDEDLRPEKLINDDILGFHGNFKQLIVD